MYSNKENINILTSLLMQHGVHHVVVCPGSRNSPLVHNFNEAPGLKCYPVTDERSAGFFALGLCQKAESAVAVCVTSGSALLNVAPAVAEAYYQHCPLVVISADRPQQWIDQMDGQTMQQPGALQGFVRKTVTLPEPHDDEQRWYCNRLVNEALLAACGGAEGPVHINVPISEPLFEYTQESLPAERMIFRYGASASEAGLSALAQRLMSARRPMVVVGQQQYGLIAACSDNVSRLRKNIVLLYENLCFDDGYAPHFEEVFANAHDERLKPDLIVYIGGTLVSKRLKQFLRKAADAETWLVGAEGEVNDTFMNLSAVVQSCPSAAFEVLASASGQVSDEARQYYSLWQSLLDVCELRMQDYTPKYSAMAAVKYFEEQLQDMDYDYAVQYANSSAVRLGNIFAQHRIWCNRGINGIEGCVSTAAGMAAVTDGVVFCVVGDLAFFYDQNALWNRNLKGNLRILLLNNGCGSIFSKFDGLRKSDARDMVMGNHNASAEGICTQNDCGYMKATNRDEMQIGIVRLLTIETERPVVLEVFTDPADDNWAMEEYMTFKLGL